MTYYKKIREEVRPCVSCNENHLIYDRNKWLCKDCYNKKKQEKLNRKTLEMKKNDLNAFLKKYGQIVLIIVFIVVNILGQNLKRFISVIFFREVHIQH